MFAIRLISRNNRNIIIAIVITFIHNFCMIIVLIIIVLTIFWVYLNVLSISPIFPAADSNNDGDNQHQRCCRDSYYQLKWNDGFFIRIILGCCHHD